MQPLFFAGGSLKVTNYNNFLIIRPSFCIGICVGLLLLPMQWVLAWFLASAIHEFGHLLVLKFLKIPVLRITLNLNGTYIETGYMSPMRELFSALAGPLAGFFCIFASSCFPFLAICGFALSVYNLLLLPNFDGGRAVLILLQLLLPEERAETAYKWVIFAQSLALILTGICLWHIWKLGVLMLLACIWPIIKCCIIKIPCKHRKQIVQ